MKMVMPGWLMDSETLRVLWGGTLSFHLNIASKNTKKRMLILEKIMEVLNLLEVS